MIERIPAPAAMGAVTGTYVHIDIPTTADIEATCLDGAPAHRAPSLLWACRAIPLGCIVGKWLLFGRDDDLMLAAVALARVVAVAAVGAGTVAGARTRQRVVDRAEAGHGVNGRDL